MEEPKTDFRDASRAGGAFKGKLFEPENQVGYKRLDTGSLQRIADALERQLVGRTIDIAPMIKAIADLQKHTDKKIVSLNAKIHQQNVRIRQLENKLFPLG